jgi:hypothetical protein
MAPDVATLIRATRVRLRVCPRRPDGWCSQRDRDVPTRLGRPAFEGTDRAYPAGDRRPSSGRDIDLDRDRPAIDPRGGATQRQRTIERSESLDALLHRIDTRSDGLSAMPCPQANANTSFAPPCLLLFAVGPLLFALVRSWGRSLGGTTRKGKPRLSEKERTGMSGSGRRRRLTPPIRDRSCEVRS